MGWETNVDKSKFLSADERILLALYLINQEKSIWWLAGWLGPEYKGKNVYSTLSRLAKRQLITASRSNLYEVKVRPYKTIGKYQITQLGIAWIGRRFPLVVARRREGLEGPEGEEGATLTAALTPPLAAVVIDAAEVKGRRRRLIFDELKRWRYGRLARGVYLTAAPAAQTAVAEFVSQYRLGGYVNLMTIYPNEEPKAMADRVFRLKERNGQWRLLIDRMFEWSKSKGLSLAPAKVRPYSQLTGLRRIRQDFLQMLVTEPGLPPELLPENYFMNKAIEIILINIDDRR